MREYGQGRKQEQLFWIGGRVPPESVSRSDSVGQDERTGEKERKDNQRQDAMSPAAPPLEIRQRATQIGEYIQVR
jgi:hypothetical protein